MKSFKTWTYHFVSPLRIFVSAHVIITSITALGMFTNRCYLSSSSVAAYRLACSEIPLLINEKKLERSPENGRSDDQIGRWLDSFSSATCFVLWYSTLFLPMTTRVTSEHFSFGCLLWVLLLTCYRRLCFSIVRPPASLMKRWLNGLCKLKQVKLSKSVTRHRSHGKLIRF